MGRRNLGVAVTVLLMAALVGVAVYGIANIANEPQKAQGATGTGGKKTATDALKEAAPLINNQEWGRAIAILSLAAESYPLDQDVRLALARCYVGMKDWDKANEAFTAALAIGPESAMLHAEAGMTANVAGKLMEAERHFALAQNLDPKDARHPLYLGMVQIKQGNDRGAMVSLVHATVLNPEIAEAWGTMAELELRVNHTAMALQHIENARKLQPELLRWRVVKAKAHMQQNEPRQALELLQGLPENERYTPAVTRVMVEGMGMLRKSKAEINAVWTSAIEYAKGQGKSDEAKQLQAAADIWYMNFIRE